MLSRIKKTFSLLAVLLGLIAVVATSQNQQSLRGGTFNVASDCSNPILETTITVVSNQVTAPSGVDYQTIGFPSLTVYPSEDVSGTVGSANRVCKPTYSNGTDGEWIYSCFDDGSLACTIYLKSS